jgi:hypothetical protein
MSRLLCVLTVANAGTLQSQSTTAAEDSARRSVQAFYDWYVPRAAHPGKRDMIMFAATNGPLRFQPELVRWLRIDSTARARNKDEVDGLDGDPYLNSQDPCKKYTVRAVHTQGTSFLADVVGTGECETRAKPDVVVELMRDRGRWTVVEFHDPERQNAGLIPLLRQLHPKAR